MEKKSLNIEKLKEQLDGSEKLIRILLEGFLEKHSNVDEIIRAYTVEGRFEDAKRLIHSIKGLSGNLAAENLEVLSIKLENEYKKVEENREIELNDFSLELKKVVSEIKQFISEIIR